MNIISWREMWDPWEVSLDCKTENPKAEKTQMPKQQELGPTGSRASWHCGTGDLKKPEDACSCRDAEVPDSQA